MSNADIKRLQDAMWDAADISDGSGFTNSEDVIRAVLQALREPSAEMIKAGYARLDQGNESDEWFSKGACTVRAAHIAMIDALLAD